ncbi:MAG: hypothetical protein JAY99_03600 [Candidatus Thiodiazotropha lotti]|uniref:Uncharacterized protein n=1 Tax=Candidatus Thiodiazotropha endoloripes TaxID=1818881 RepID=A0A1E2UL84_9GAMM|nr:hypothetical protein [Candidatus Thiodiazotropha endoloripes]MCG7899395.1 hypothetical protein [Candidatus Thiodiazotropha weberae]MCG7992083.1 hypothetical protein [Candidatus Thiodiazotropha lotti]MCG7904001.1 hypothetical protein [Candidatus Thiodiazotropha weberae]MCG7998587.1 hypothetical protein [Candidatus Thiodiazotropha lotti]MCW4183741.1 hypothetical protein [Candidatus Thiodiazotropha weberae]
MRFPLLKPGQKFIYQEKRYTKTGPMTASEEESGKTCMIRRSAEVTLLQGHDEGQQAIPQQFARDQVVILLKAYQRELKTRVAEAMGEGGAQHPSDILKVVEDCDVVTFLKQIDHSGIS